MREQTRVHIPVQDICKYTVELRRVRRTLSLRTRLNGTQSAHRGHTCKTADRSNFRARGARVKASTIPKPRRRGQKTSPRSPPASQRSRNDRHLRSEVHSDDGRDGKSVARFDPWFDPVVPWFDPEDAKAAPRPTWRQGGRAAVHMGGVQKHRGGSAALMAACAGTQHAQVGGRRR